MRMPLLLDSYRSVAASRRAFVLLVAAALVVGIVATSVAWRDARAAVRLEERAQRANEAGTVAAGSPSPTRVPVWVDLPDSFDDHDAFLSLAFRTAAERHVVVSGIDQRVVRLPTPERLGERQWRLEVRGDYRDIAALWLSLLDRSPGLVLQRLELRRVPPGPGVAPTDGPADVEEARIELVQYARSGSVGAGSGGAAP
jgi:hypothetical protein